MRVPFPLRVFLSYLFVLIVAALPTYIYLELMFKDRLASYEVQRLVTRTQKLVVRLTGLSHAKRLQELQRVIPMHQERVTYISMRGQVLYDSIVKAPEKMDNHLKRKEVQLALSKHGTRLDFAPTLEGVGVSRRKSTSTKKGMIYVAMRIPASKGHPGGVLRLAILMSRLEVFKETLLQVFRNSLAGAISVALVLSLISAFVFMRPLQTIASKAVALSKGDYSITFTRLGNDEIGDVGRSLQQLSVELRRRLAMAEASDVLLIQLVQIEETPIAVFDEDGKLRAINGAARTLLDTKREDARDVLGRWVASANYKSLWRAAKETGEPQQVSIEVEEGKRTVRGMLHLIQHPSGTSFGVFLGVRSVRGRRSFLPMASEVRSVTVAAIVEASLQRVGAALESLGVTVSRPAEPFELLVADAQERLVLGLSIIFENAALYLSEGQSIPLRYEESPLYAVVAVEARVSSFAMESVRMLFEPIGAKIQIEAGVCHLRWPKA